MKKGFVSLLLVGIVAIAALGLAGYEWYQGQSPKLGSSIQTQLTDTLGTFRTNVNTNFSNIDSEIASITSTQAGYGNIISQNTPLGVTVGGTGTTTVPSDKQFFSVNGTTPTWKTFTFGSGLNSTTTATSVIISTQAIDTSANFTWTGSQTFSSTTALNGATTLGGSTIITGVNNAILKTNGSGVMSGITSSATGTIVSWNGSSWQNGIYSTIQTGSTSSAGNIATTTLPAISANGRYMITLRYFSNNTNTNNNTTTITLSDGTNSVTLDTYAVPVSTNGSISGIYCNAAIEIDMLDSTTNELVMTKNNCFYNNGGYAYNLHQTNAVTLPISSGATGFNFANGGYIQVGQTQAYSANVTSTVTMLQ